MKRNMMVLPILAILLLSAGYLAPQVHASSTLVLTCNADTYVDNDNPNNNYGTANPLIVGGYEYVALMNFSFADIWNLLSQGDTISSITLTMNIQTAGTANVHCLDDWWAAGNNVGLPWTENGTTYSNDYEAEGGANTTVFSENCAQLTQVSVDITNQMLTAYSSTDQYFNAANFRGLGFQTYDGSTMWIQSKESATPETLTVTYTFTAPSPTPTATSSPSPTPQPSLNNVLFSDDFATNQPNAQLTLQTGDTIANGKLTSSSDSYATFASTTGLIEVQVMEKNSGYYLYTLTGYNSPSQGWLAVEYSNGYLRFDDDYTPYLTSYALSSSEWNNITLQVYLDPTEGSGSYANMWANGTLVMNNFAMPSVDGYYLDTISFSGEGITNEFSNVLVMNYSSSVSPTPTPTAPSGDGGGGGGGGGLSIVPTPHETVVPVPAPTPKTTITLAQEIVVGAIVAVAIVGGAVVLRRKH